LTLYNCNPSTTIPNTPQTRSPYLLAAPLLCAGLLIPSVGSSLMYVLTSSPTAAKVYGGLSAVQDLRSLS
jgi:hypothetical protein